MKRHFSYSALAAVGLIQASDEEAHCEPVRVADQARLFRLIQLTHSMAQTYRSSTSAHQARLTPSVAYDSVYAEAMAAFDEQTDA